MPRIAATLGVFGLVVLALGLNMAQFPIAFPGAAPTANSLDTESKVASTDELRVPVASLRPPDWETEPAMEDRPHLQEKVDEQTQVHEQAQFDEQAQVHEQFQEQEQERIEETAEPEATTEQSGHSVTGTSEMPDAGPTVDQQLEVADERHEPVAQPQGESATEAVQEASSGPSDREFGSAPEFGSTGYGSVYNPLEPRDESGSSRPPVLAQPSSVAPLDLVAPSAVFPSPAYAGESLPNATEGRGLVPIERDQDATPPPSAEEVVRLPSVDNVWPGKPASQPPTLGWYPADGYPATQISQ